MADDNKGSKKNSASNESKKLPVREKQASHSALRAAPPLSSTEVVDVVLPPSSHASSMRISFTIKPSQSSEHPNSDKPDQHVFRTKRDMPEVPSSTAGWRKDWKEPEPPKEIETQPPISSTLPKAHAPQEGMDVKELFPPKRSGPPKEESVAAFPTPRKSVTLSTSVPEDDSPHKSQPQKMSKGHHTPKMTDIIIQAQQSYRKSKQEHQEAAQFQEDKSEKDSKRKSVDHLRPAGDAGDPIPLAESTTPSVAAVTKILPPDAIKTVPIRHKIGTTESRPLAPKLLVLKRPDSPKVPSRPPSKTPCDSNDGMLGNDDVEDTPEDTNLERKLTRMVNRHREYLLRKLKRTRKTRGPQYRFPEMAETLKESGIPCPVNEDFGRLQGTHSRWDPKGTVLEYYSPILRTFVPVNMRGRYRGCWNTDDCVKGVNISKIPPKRDAREGFVDRGRHINIQEKYDEMSPIAEDETHLDYLVEMQAYVAETLPIPIFYDLLHLGLEVENEQLKILIQEEGYSPLDPILISATDHAEQLRRKIQMYGALGLERLETEKKSLGQFKPEWLKSRDEIIREIMKRKDQQRYCELSRMETEASMRGNARREQTNTSFGNKRTSKSKGSNFEDRHSYMSNGVNPAISTVEDSSKLEDSSKNSKQSGTKLLNVRAFGSQSKPRKSNQVAPEG